MSAVTLTGCSRNLWSRPTILAMKKIGSERNFRLGDVERNFDVSSKIYSCFFGFWRVKAKFMLELPKFVSGVFRFFDML